MMKRFLTLVLWLLFLSLAWGWVFANDDSVCVHRPYRLNAPASLDVPFTGSPTLSLEQRIDFIGETWQIEGIGHVNEEQSLQDQFCSEYLIVLMGTADGAHVEMLQELDITQFEKDTRFASCTVVNLVPNQERAAVIRTTLGTWSYLTERTKSLLEVQTFFDYPTHFEGRSTENVVFPYYMIVGQDGRVKDDGASAEELFEEMKNRCRSYDCDNVVTNPEFPADAETDVDNDGLDNDDEEEFDIDGDNQENGFPTERHLRGDVDGDGGKNVYDMDIDCDGIPNELDETPYGNFSPIPECGNGEVDIELTETCDDGNEIDTDECTNECKDARCGDGIIRAGVETCDDGNLNNSDGCSNTCKSETCGDGIVQPWLEECDDGNNQDGDGCSAECLREKEEEDPEDPGENSGGSSGGSSNGNTNGATNGTTDGTTVWTIDGTIDGATTGEDDPPEDDPPEDDPPVVVPPSDTTWGDSWGNREGELVWWPNQPTVAGNSWNTEWGKDSWDKLSCIDELTNCKRSCDPSQWSNCFELFAPKSCLCTCESKYKNCENCMIEWIFNWVEDPEHLCACKYFDHIYLNTDIPFIWQCILKRPAIKWNPNDTVSSSNLPNLDTAFPRILSGISRLIQSLILVFGFVAIVVAGFMISAGGMSESSKTKWVNILKWVMIALILLGASGIILRLINPNFFRPSPWQTNIIDDTELTTIMDLVNEHS